VNSNFGVIDVINLLKHIYLPISYHQEYFGRMDECNLYNLDKIEIERFKKYIDLFIYNVTEETKKSLDIT